MTSPKYANTGDTGRFYLIPGYEDTKFRSVTTILNVIAKPALYRWYAKKAAEYAYTNMQYSPKDQDAFVKLCCQAPFDSTRVSQVLGTNVHKACELAVGGDLEAYESFCKANPEVEPFVDNFISFIKKGEWQVECCERTVFDHKEGYAGTLDFILRDKNGKHYVVDIKTGGVYPTASLQMVAYARAPMYVDSDGKIHENTIDIEGGFVLELKKTLAKPHHMDIGESQYKAFLAVRDVSVWDNETSKSVIFKG